MSSTFSIKRGDTLPVLRATITLNGEALDVTGSTVEFYFDRDGVTLTRSATLVTPASGIVEYAFVSGDWAPGAFDVGRYLFEAQITFSGGDILTVPTSGQLSVRVTQDISD